MGEKRRHGYSRDHRPDCVQVVVALAITPEGLPMAYEVMPGNIPDRQTLVPFLKRIRRRFGRARRTWIMDRGIPTEETLALMRRRRRRMKELPKRLKELKGDLGLRPIHHSKESRAEAHVFVAFMASCLHVCLRGHLRGVAGA